MLYYRVDNWQTDHWEADTYSGRERIFMDLGHATTYAKTAADHDFCRKSRVVDIRNNEVLCEFSSKHPGPAASIIPAAAVQPLQLHEPDPNPTLHPRPTEESSARNLRGIRFRPRR